MDKFTLIRAALALLVAASLGACGGSGGGGDSPPRPVSPPPVSYSYSPSAEIVDVVACAGPGQPVADCTAAASEVVVRDPADAVGTPTSGAAQWLEIDYTSTPAGGPAQSWAVSATQDWLTIDPASGTATAGDPVRVALTAACPVAGARTADLSLALGGQTVAVPWAVSCRPGELSISGLEIYQGPLTRVWAGPEAGWRQRVPPPYGVQTYFYSAFRPPHFEVVHGKMAIEMPMLEVAERRTLLVVRVAHESPETPSLRVSVEDGAGGLLAEWLPGDAHIVRHHTLPPGEIAPCEAAGAPHPWCLGAGDPAELPGAEFRPVELPPRDSALYETEHRVELAGAVLCTGAASPHVDCTAADQILDGLWKGSNSVRVVADPFDAIGKSSESVWDLKFPVEYDTAWRASNDHDERFVQWPAPVLREYPFTIPVELPALEIALVPLATANGAPAFEQVDVDRYLEGIRQWLPVGRHHVRVTPPLDVSHRDPHAGYRMRLDVSAYRRSDVGRSSDREVYAGIYPGPGDGSAFGASLSMDIIGRAFDGPHEWAGRSNSGTAFTAPADRLWTITHEFGHMMSLGHAPCAVPVPDPYWPTDAEYAEARTGPNRLYAGEGVFVHGGVDLMSYCEGRGVVSDWYYNLAAMWRAAALPRSARAGRWVPCWTADAGGQLPDWAEAACGPGTPAETPSEPF